MGYTRKIFGSTVMFLMMCASMLLCSCTKDSDDNYDFSGYTGGKPEITNHIGNSTFHFSKFYVTNFKCYENATMTIKESPSSIYPNQIIVTIADKNGKILKNDYWTLYTITYTPDGGMHFLRIEDGGDWRTIMEIYKIGEDNYIGRYLDAHNTTWNY